MADVNKMYTYLRGYFIGANMSESLKALSFASQQHKDQTHVCTNKIAPKVCVHFINICHFFFLL